MINWEKPSVLDEETKKKTWIGCKILAGNLAVTRVCLAGRMAFIPPPAKLGLRRAGLASWHLMVYTAAWGSWFEWSLLYIILAFLEWTQPRVNTGWTLLVLERSVYKVGPWLVVGRLGISTVSNGRGWLIIWFILYTANLPRVWNFGSFQIEDIFVITTKKNLGHQVFNGFSGQEHWLHILRCWRKEHAWCVPHRRGRIWNFSRLHLCLLPLMILLYILSL